MAKGIISLEESTSPSEEQKKVGMVNRSNSIRKTKLKTSNEGIMVSRSYDSVPAGGKNHGIQAENYLFDGFLTLGLSCSTDLKKRIQEMQVVPLSSRNAKSLSGCFYIFLEHKDAADDLQVFSMSFSHKLLTLLACDLNHCNSVLYEYLRENVISDEELRSVACLRKNNSTEKMTLHTLDGFELVSDVLINCIKSEEGICQTLLSLHIDRQNIMKIMSLRTSTAASELISVGNLVVKKDKEAYEKASREFIKKYYSQELQNKIQVDIINDEEQTGFQLNNIVTQDKVSESLNENKDFSHSLKSPLLFFHQSCSHNSEDENYEDEDSQDNQMELLLTYLVKKQKEANQLFINTNLAESIDISSPSAFEQSTESSYGKSSPDLHNNQDIIFDCGYQERTSSSNIIQSHSSFLNKEEVTYDLKLFTQEITEVQTHQNDYIYNDHYFQISPTQKLNWNSDDDFFPFYS